MRNRYFDHLSHKTAMERTNVFIQTTPHLFQDAPESAPETILTIDDLQIRRERQTFTRLEHSGAVLFTVRTFMEPLTQLGDEGLRALIVRDVRGDLLARHALPENHRLGFVRTRRDTFDGK